MSFRFHKGIPNISIFHSPSSQTSNAALKLLREATSTPYPPGAKTPLEYKLEVVSSQAPTTSQISTIQSYLGSNAPLSSFLSSAAELTSASSPDAVQRMLNSNPEKMKYPIVVNWDDGEAAIGSVEGVEAMLKRLSARRDEEGKGDSSKSKGWFGGLFKGSGS